MDERQDERQKENWAGVLLVLLMLGFLLGGWLLLRLMVPQAGP
jgi:hypothetical protein